MKSEKEGIMEIEKKFGTYSVKSDWNEMQTASGEIFIYMPPHSSEKKKNNSITIHSSRNPYAAKDHRIFRNAIMEQLQKKVDLFSDPQINAYGKYTSNDLVMYVFCISEDNGIETKQYYIVGEKRFCVIQSINYDKNLELDQVAEEIADSFRWKEAVNE